MELFALSEVFTRIEEYKLNKEEETKYEKTQRPTLLDYWKLKFSILRSSVLGAIIGIFPGAGATIAAFLSYNLARRVTRIPIPFSGFFFIRSYSSFKIQFAIIIDPGEPVFLCNIPANIRSPTP